MKQSIQLLTVSIIASALYGCAGDSGGSSGSANFVTPPPPTDPGVFIDTASMMEGNVNGSESNLTFTVTLNKVVTNNVQVNWQTEDGSALDSDNDYRSANGIVVIPAGQKQATFDVAVVGDLNVEFTESFVVKLSNLVYTGTEPVKLARDQANGLILNDDGAYIDAMPLNDTGMVGCAVEGFLDPGLCSEANAFQNQDAHSGRDAEAMQSKLYKVGSGRFGFDFTKLDANGSPLPVSATDWSCVRDNHTGRVWEIKTESGLQGRYHTYSWFFNDGSVLTGGDNGSANGGVCGGGIQCDTQHYIAAVNAMNNNQGLCGRQDWRLPTVEELRSINDYTRGYNTRPTLDTNFFPRDPAVLEARSDDDPANAQRYETGTWSNITYYPQTGTGPLPRAWGLSFQFGTRVGGTKQTDKLYVRLVNGS